jgi:dienelactone hydrolase
VSARPNVLHPIAALLVVGTLLGAALVGGTGPAGADAAPTAAAARRPLAIRHLTLTLVDRSRPTDDPAGVRTADRRTLATEVWVPRARGPFPLVVFAHGNNGHPRKLTQLLSTWARAGYVVAAPAFPLTNDESGAASVIPDYVQQPADLSFVITQLLRQSRRAGSPLSGRVDPRHIGAAGHSLGGATVYGLVAEPCCRDRRVDAAIFMDAIRLPFAGAVRPRVEGPVLFIHIEGDPATPYAGTLEQYRRARPPKLMMTLTQGIHFEPYENAPSPHDRAVADATTAFWDAYLAGRRGAVPRIVSGGTEAGSSTVDARLR